MNINYERNKKYFDGPQTTYKISTLTWVLFGLAVVFLVLPLGLLKIVGFIVALAFGVTSLKNKTAIVTDPGVPDSEIDAQLYGHGTDVIDKALDKFGLDGEEFQEIDPIILSGPYYKSIASDYMTRKGNDNQVRPSNAEITVFLFSAQQVFKYNYRYSLINPNEFSDSTDEYFYRDIVTVSTETATVEYQTGKDKTMAKYNYERFVMATTGGTAVGCAVRASDDSVQQSIKAMRALLREKKNV